MARTLTAWLSGCLLLVAMGGCGEPAISYHDALEVIFLPLEGARGLPGDITPSIFFSAEVEESSISADTVFLQSTGWSCIEQSGSQVCSCGNGWTRVAGTPQLEGSPSTAVEFVPSSALPAQSCFVMVCTTAVRGIENAPLRSLGLPATTKMELGLSSGVDPGALQQFWTAE